MKKYKPLFPALPVCIILLAWSVAGKGPSSAVTGTNTVDSGLYERNILPAIQAINNNVKYRPSTQFRAGHVTPTVLKNYFEKTADGFSIKLSHSNIPTPAVVNGNLLVSGGFGSKQYYSFGATDGQLKWGVNLDDDGPSSPAIHDNIIVFNTESCTIFACDLVTGKQVWSYWLGDPLMSMPTIANGMVFTAYPANYGGEPVWTEADSSGRKIVISPSHVLIAFDLKTGKILWQKWIDSDVMSAPVAQDNLLYVTTFSGALYKVKQATGEILEAKAMRATSAPVFGADNELIVSRRTDRQNDSAVYEAIVRGKDRYKAVYNKKAYYLDQKVQDVSALKQESQVLDAGNGFTGGAPASANSAVARDNIGQSNVASLQSFQGSRALYHGGILFNTMGDEIVSTGADGNVNWKYSLHGDLKTQGGFIGTPPIYANGYIISATLNGEVLVINAKTGKMVKKYEIKEPVRYQPVAEKGWIYVTTSTGKLHAINTGDASITGWNMWGGNAQRTNTTGK